jgi:adenylate cyclase
MKLLHRAWADLDRRVRDRQNYFRVQVGSAIALGAGLFISALFLAGWLDPLDDLLAQFLFGDVEAVNLLVQDRGVAIIMIFMVALLAGATIPHTRALTAAALSIIYFAMYLSYAYRYFSEGIRVQPIYPLLALVLTFIGAMTFRYFSIERPRAFISRLFHQAAPPDSVERVLTVFDAGALPLQGARRRVTVMYVDLRDLRLLAETLDAVALIELFNRYVTRIVAMVFQNEGFVTKQAGDTTLAAWNLVLDQPDHALRAARAATEIKREIRAINLELLKENSIEIGVGVATGSVVIGRIHIPTRAEFALIGEVVTLAERMAMKTDRGVFVDPPTRELIADEFDSRQVNPIRLRRKTDPQIVWEIVEVIAPEEEPSEEPAESVPQPN